MKPKKLLVTLLVATSLLSACNNGSPQTGSAAQVNQTQSTQAAEKKNPFIEFATKGLIEGFKNPFALPGEFFSEWILGWLFPEKDEKLEMLKKMDKKLDDIIATLGNSIGIGTATLNTINEFYKNQMNSNLKQSLTKMNDDTGVITGKFQPYVVQGVFGDATANNIEELYQVAKENCDDEGIYDALEATPGRQSKRGLQSSLGSNLRVDQMFTDFITDYASDDNKGDGNFYIQLAANQQIYLGTILNAMQPGDDLMNYINYYNYNNILYAKKLLGAFQNLYTMQIAQLAYRNACNATIKLTNVRLPKRVNGIDGFNADIDALNTTYNKAYTQLESNIKTYLAPIDNKKLYSFVNDYVHTGVAGGTFLADKSFNTNESTPGSCAVSHLVTVAYKQDSQGFSGGIGHLVAHCITANGVKGVESTTMALEIPFSMRGNTITELGMNNIGFDPQTKTLQFKLNSSAISDKTIFNIDQPKDFSTIYDLSNMITFGQTNFEYHSGRSNWYYWRAPHLRSGDGVDFFKNRYTDGFDQMTQDVKDTMPEKDDGDPNNTHHDENRIFYNDVTKSRNKNIVDNGSFADWYLGTYNGRLFAIKVQNIHYDENPIGSKNTPVIKRVVGIACLTNEPNPKNPKELECTRVNSENLKWFDGTEVRLNLDMYSRAGYDSSFIDVVGGTSASSMRPVGAYQDSCTSIKWMNGTLIATCSPQPGYNADSTSELNYLAECQPGATVDNLKGKLVCHKAP